MTANEIAQLCGWAGSVFSGGGYVAVAVGAVRGDRPTFQLMNIVGAVGLGLAALSARVWPAVTMNALWIMIGLAALALARRRAGTAADAAPPPPAIPAARAPSGRVVVAGRDGVRRADHGRRRRRGVSVGFRAGGLGVVVRVGPCAPSRSTRHDAHRAGPEGHDPDPRDQLAPAHGRKASVTT
jgi:hypothetical protein